MAPTTLPRVLVIDDDSRYARATQRVLQRDAQVTICDGGAAALELLRAGVVFDLILCDVMMPHRSGPEFFEEAVAEMPELKDRIVFVTGGMQGENATAVARLGARCLQKPVPTEELRALVAGACSPKR